MQSRRVTPHAIHNATPPTALQSQKNLKGEGRQAESVPVRSQLSRIEPSEMNATRHRPMSTKDSEDPKKVVWNIPLEDEDIEELTVTDDSVIRAADTRGRKSERFPTVNLTTVAKQVGCTRSHLSKILLGQNRPSIDLAEKIAIVLGRDVNWVASLYKKE